MGEARRKKSKRTRVALIVPTDADVIEHGGTITTAEGTRRIDPSEVAAAVEQIAAENQPPADMPPKAKTNMEVSEEIDSVVKVIGKAIEADMKTREVRTVSVLAALFRCTSNIAKTYLTQCAKGRYLDEGRADLVKLTEIQDNDLAAYIASLEEGMSESGQAH